MIKMTAGVAHPWLCDAMGHLNTRHYVGLFDDAALVLLARLGHSTQAIATTGLGWVDVHNEIDYVAEVPLGKVVEVYARVSRIGNKSLSTELEMRGIDDGVLHARMSATLVRFDVGARKGVPLTATLRERAAEFRLLSPGDDVESVGSGDEG